MEIEEVRKLIQIIDSMKYSVDNDYYFEISGEDAKVLYDYITKLQEENSILKEYKGDE